MLLQLPPVNVKIIQLFLLMLSGLFVSFIAWIKTKNSLSAFAVFYLIITTPALNIYARRYRSEILIIFLISIVSFALFIAFTKNRNLYYTVSGILLALLTLTRAIFLYFIPVLVAFLYFQGYLKKINLRETNKKILFVLVPVVLITGSWMVRNFVTFNRPFIASRGGFVLNARAEYNKMNLEEYFASFFFWSNCLHLYDAGTKLFCNTASERLDRTNPQGYFRQAKYERYHAAGGIKKTGRKITAADKTIMNSAVMKILRNPVKHLAVTVPIALRGIYVYRPITNSYRELKRTDIRRLKNFRSFFEYCFLNFLLFFSFFVVFFTGLFKKDFPLTGALLPAFYSFSFYSLLTHNLPRYNAPLIPLLWLCTMLFVYYAGEKLKSFVNHRLHRNASSILPGC